MNIFSGPVFGSPISEPACVVNFDLAASGYVEEEFFAAETARGYDVRGEAPVLVLQAEGDLVGPLAARLARQPDGDRLRWWEIAGTSPADSYLIGAASAPVTAPA